MPAKGLTGNGYDGHTLWDTELFVLPLLTFVRPDAAANALRWRHSTVDLARERARELRLAGAAFPWRTIGGRECSGYWPAGSAALHINADLASAVLCYATATGDDAFTREAGVELLVETARLWLRVGYHDDGGAFHIDGVTGPDEYTAFVDDNLYTNVMARRNLLGAVDAVRRFPSVVDVADGEIAAWEAAATAMHLPYDDKRGVYQQCAGFTDRPEWDFGNSGYPLLLHHPYQLLGHLDLAHAYLKESALHDLCDLSDTTEDGLHIAALAGAWTILVVGSGGFRHSAGHPAFAPRLPGALRRLRFSVRWRSRRIRVTVTRDGVEYLLRDGDPSASVEVTHHGEAVTLHAGEPVTRPVPELADPGPTPGAPTGPRPLPRAGLEARAGDAGAAAGGEDGGVCTVLLRFDPDASWPLLVAAVRDEFVGRPWHPPARHWPGTPYLGGLDLIGGGTWLAVDPGAAAFAALLNGPPLPATAAVRPTRGTLALTALSTGAAPADPSAYDAFHLLLGTPRRCELWSWTGDAYTHRVIDPGTHIVVNLGLDATADPLVGHYAPLLSAATDPDPKPGVPPTDAWGDWIPLLDGDGLAPDDDRALIVAREALGAPYGSTSATLLALRDGGVRYDFTANPGPAAEWTEIAVAP